MERTLVIFKPDAVMRGLVGDIIRRFERAGLKIVGMKMVRPGYEHYAHHYETIGTLKTRKGEEIFESQLAIMQEGPVIAVVLEGVDLSVPFSSPVDFFRDDFPFDPDLAVTGICFCFLI